MKPFDPDDPLLTAYALGELEGEELREVELLIAADPAAARHVESIRAAASGFGEAFEREPAPQVEPIRAVEIEPKRRAPFIPWLFYASTAAAACFFVVLVIRIADPASTEAPRELAAEAPLPAAVEVPADGNEADAAASIEGSSGNLRRQSPLQEKEKAEAAASEVREPQAAAKRANTLSADSYGDGAAASRPAAAPPPPATLGEMKDSTAGSRKRTDERGEMRSGVLERDLDKFRQVSAVTDLRAKLQSGGIPSAVDTVALLAELGFRKSDESAFSELGNTSAQMAVSDSPMPDPEAALLRAVEGFARLVAARTPARDEAWDRVLGDARYAAGSDSRRLEFVELIGEAREAVATRERTN